MPPSSETLDISQLGQTDSPKLGEPNAEAAAAARRRIAELPDPHDRDISPEPRIITDRDLLATKIAQSGRPAKQHRQPKSTKKKLIPSRLRPLLTAIATFGILLALFKAPVLISQLGYHPNTTAPITTASTGTVIPAENTITIPKINVHAPVIFDNTRDETQILDDLENGVIHYAGTALPGQIGNSAIFGHSSNDWWEPGNYKYIFVLLDKLQPGDQFYVDYQSKRYIYQVTGTQVVEPTDLSVLNPTSTPTMTLITCTPPGTSWKRLVVTAEQISPNPAEDTKAITPSGQEIPSTLPSSEGGGGFWNDIKATVSGIVQGITSIFGGAQTNTNSNELPAIK